MELLDGMKEEEEEEEEEEGTLISTNRTLIRRVRHGLS
jgi:hypothetical protein